MRVSPQQDTGGRILQPLPFRFDLHAGTTCLVPQCLNSALNVRADEYGGSADNRARFRGTLIANAGFDRASAHHAIEHAKADLVSFGNAFIGNPDLVRRLREGASPPITQSRRHKKS